MNQSLWPDLGPGTSPQNKGKNRNVRTSKSFAGALKKQIPINGDEQTSKEHNANEDESPLIVCNKIRSDIGHDEQRKQAQKQRKLAAKQEKKIRREEDVRRQLVAPKGYRVQLVQSNVATSPSLQAESPASFLHDTSFPTLGSPSSQQRTRVQQDVKLLNDDNDRTNKRLSRRRREPITVDLAHIIVEKTKKQAPSRHEAKLQKIKKTEEILSGNPLDSSQPVRHRGKIRETPKPKRPSSLKTAIMKHRVMKKTFKVENGESLCDSVVKMQSCTTENVENDLQVGDQIDNNVEILHEHIEKVPDNLHVTVMKEKGADFESDVEFLHDHVEKLQISDDSAEKNVGCAQTSDDSGEKNVEFLHDHVENTHLSENIAEKNKEFLCVCEQSIERCAKHIEDNLNYIEASSNEILQVSDASAGLINQNVSSEQNIVGHGDTLQNEAMKEQRIVADTVRGDSLKTVSSLDILHSNRFRNYCDHMLDAGLDDAVRSLLRQLVNLQDRTYAKDPVKAGFKKRILTGLHETRKALMIKKVALLVIAPNLEKCPQPGGLDEKISELIGLARDKKVDYTFALTRRKLGHTLLKKVAVSCVAVVSAAGAEEELDRVVQILPDLRQRYNLAVGKTAEPAAAAAASPETIQDKRDVNKVVVSSLLSVLEQSLKPEQVPTFLQAIEAVEENY